DGLWALKVGNGQNGGNANDVYFTAGLSHENHGLFGKLEPVDPGTPEGPAEKQALIAAVEAFKIDLNTVVQDITTHSTSALQDDVQTLKTSLADLMQAAKVFASDVRMDLLSGLGSGAAAAHHALDQMFASLGRLE